jgi:hypothetical protein
MYRVTLNLVSFTYGPGETYITPDLGSPNSLVASLQAFFRARFAMLTNDYELVGCRVSSIDGVRASEDLLTGDRQPFGSTDVLHVPAGGNYVLEPNLYEPEQRTNLNVLVRYNTGHKAIKFLSGVPYGIVKSHPFSYDPAAGPLWSKAADKFFLGLAGKAGGFSPQAWKIYAKIPIPPIPNPPANDPNGIIAWQKAATGVANVGFTVSPGFGGTLVVGQKVHVYNTKLRPLSFAFGGRSPSLNGNWIVDSVVPSAGPPAGTTYFLRGTDFFDTTRIKLLGRAMPVSHQYFDILSAEGNQAGEHARGKPGGNHRGRRLTRVSLDP